MKKLLQYLGLNPKKQLILLICLLFLDIIQIIIISLFLKYFVLIFIAEFLLHYLFAYYVIQLIFFSGSSKPITRFYCWKLGVKIAESFKEQLETFRESLNDFFLASKTQLNINKFYEKLKMISSLNDTIYSYLKINNAVEYDEMSGFQKNMIISLNRLKMSLEESRIEKLIMECISRYSRRKRIRFKSYKLDINLITIQNNITKILSQINKFLLKGNFLSNTLNIMLNDAFGSLKQLKTEIKGRFFCEEFKVEVDNKKIKLDCLLIKSKDSLREKEKEIRALDNLKNKFKANSKEKETIKEDNNEGENIDNLINTNDDNSKDNNKELNEEKLEQIKEGDKESSGGENTVEKKGNNKEETKNDIVNSDTINLSLEPNNKSDINNKDSLNNNDADNEIEETEEQKSKTVMLICNRTAFPYELLAYYDKWIECYLSYGINVVIWNYRGYGDSTGTASIKNIKEDSEEIVNYLKDVMKFKKVGVHGILLGGICASYLYSKNLVSFCFIDRCFGDLYKFIDEKTFKNFSKILKYFNINNLNLSKVLSNNYENDIINNDNIYKIISYDSSKQIIENECSLKSLISEDYYENVYCKKGNLINSTSPDDTTNCQISELIFGKSKLSFSQFEQATFYIINKINQKILSKKDDIIKSNDLSDTNNQANLSKEVDISSTFRTDLSAQQNDEVITSISASDRTNDGQNSFINLKNDGENQISSVIRTHSEIDVLNNLKIYMEKLDAGGDNLINVKNLNTFFIDLLFWGSYRLGKNNIASNKQIAISAVFKKIDGVIKKIDRIVSNYQKYKIDDQKLNESLKIFLEGLKLINTFYSNKIFNETQINKENNNLIEDDKENKYKKIQSFLEQNNLGELIVLETGKDGQFNINELEAYCKHLVNSKFV